MEKENKKKNKNKKGFSFDFKNLSKEDKTKYGAFGVMFLIFCGFIWYGMSNYSDDSDKENVRILLAVLYLFQSLKNLSP